jgi:kinesin family protein 1
MPSLKKDIENDEDAQFVPEVVELQLNPVVSRKGYLNFLEENSCGWIKRYVVHSF